VNFRIAGAGPRLENPVQVGGDGHFQSVQQQLEIHGGWDDATHVHGSFKHSDGTGHRWFFHVQLVAP
jgi:hypothetical protein